MTPEYTRFAAYVMKSREPARPKRLAVFQALQYGHATVAALAASVGGNANLRAWISQAMKDGEIVRVDGKLQLPSARPAEVQMTQPDAAALLDEIGRLTRGYHTLPDGVLRFTLMRLHLISSEDQTELFEQSARDDLDFEKRMNQAREED